MTTRGRPTRRWVPVVAAVVVGLVLVGSLGIWEAGRNAYWWGTSDRMKTLLSDPMASASLLDLPLVRHEQANPVGPLGKPSGAWITNWFAADEEEPAVVQRRVVEHAAGTGWTFNASSSSDLSTNFSRRTQQGPTLLLSVAALAPGDDPEDRNRSTIRVALSYA